MLHVATLSLPIRADIGYGPIETVIHNIDQGLHTLGHRSIVACSADSQVTGEHYPTVEGSSGAYCTNDTVERRRDLDIHLAMASARLKRGDIDIIHTHESEAVEFLYDTAGAMGIPIVNTLHVPPQDNLQQPDYQRCFAPSASPPVHCTSISEFQKRQYTGLVNTEHVVHHGIAVHEYPAKEKPSYGSYLFSIGRVTPDKGQDVAVAVAKRTGSKLIMAGCVQNKAEDREYFAHLGDSIDLFAEVGKEPIGDDYYDKVIKPLLDCDSQIIYIGEISREQKKLWFRHARGTLFPIQWGEPFGLVMIESMAAGTPVIAFDKGSVPEIMVDGKTGFVVDSVDKMIAAVGRIDSIDPGECRRHVWRNFSTARMADRYVALYRQAIGARIALHAHSEVPDVHLAGQHHDAALVTG